VKFAKAVPTQAENEQMLAGAFKLVEETAAPTSLNGGTPTGHAHG
jgi:hypothetical protein